MTKKKRKTRKEKIRSAERRENKKIAFAQQKINIDRQIIKQEKYVKRAKTIRNLKVFSYVLTRTFPYILISGLTVEGLKLTGFGLPFTKDANSLEANYSLEQSLDGNVSVHKFYDDTSIFKDFYSDILIYTSWKLTDKGYERYKISYNFVGSKEVIDAILNNDYEYILSNLEEKKKEKEITNEKKESSKYLVEANIKAVDHKDKIICMETDEKNIKVTVFEVILIFFISALKFAYSYKKYESKIHEYSLDLKSEIEFLNNLKEKENRMNKQNLSLKREDYHE